MTARPSPASPFPGLGFHGFVALTASIMAVNALTIDAMLPALPAMGASLNIPDHNQRQWIVSAYLLGFGASTLIYGPLSDRFGRRPVLIIPLVLYALVSVAALLATDLTSILIVRVLQGVVAAATRVIATSIVRDCYSGRTMARVMSLSFIVFLAVPILAPSLGQLVMFVAPWQGIFLLLGVYGLAVAAFAWFKLPETLHPEDRRAIAVAPILAAFRIVLTTRQSIGYTMAMTLLFGALFGFINSVQQIFTDIFAAPDAFPIAFAAIAGTMALGSLANSRMVERLGTRLISHTALIAFIVFSVMHLAIASAGFETIYTFGTLQAVTMGCFALAGTNFGAMAMAPVGHIAGTASSIQSFISTLGSALMGAVIGQHFDGTTVPMALGFTLLGCGALVAVLITERGRLFHPVLEPNAAG